MEGTTTVGVYLRDSWVGESHEVGVGLVPDVEGSDLETLRHDADFAAQVEGAFYDVDFGGASPCAWAGVVFAFAGAGAEALAREVG